MCRRPATRLVLPCAVLAVLLSPLGVAATATRSGYETVSHIVNFADLDLTRTAGVAALYRRIKTAAQHVCEPDTSKASETLLQVNRCTREAIAQAVRDVNSSGLTSLHMVATNQMDFP